MRKIYFLLLLIPFTLFLFCADRNRTNPLDPKNPETDGKINGLSINSQERTVRLFWDRFGLAKVDSILIYRQKSDGVFENVASVGNDVFSFNDKNVQYGNIYRYYVTAMTGSYETPPSAQVEVKPGPTYLWVGDVNDGMFTRLSHDLSAVIFRFGSLRFPSLIAVLPKERSAWCYTLFSDIIYKLNGEGEVEVVLRDFGRITDMAADTSNGDLWISETSFGRIYRVDRYGEIRALVETLPSPERLVVDSKRHVAWIIDDSSKSVFRMTKSGFINAKNQEELQNPQDIALDGSLDNIWIADDKRVLGMDFSGSGTGVYATGFNNAYLIDIDNMRNHIWVMDRGSSGNNSTLFKLSTNGEVFFQLAEFSSPTSIDVNEFDGSCIVSDPGNRAIYKVSEDGAEIQIIKGFISPQVVAVEHH